MCIKKIQLIPSKSFVCADSQFNHLNGSFYFFIFLFLLSLFFWVLQSGYRKNHGMKKLVKNIKKSGLVQGSAFWGLEVFFNTKISKLAKNREILPSNLTLKIFVKKSILRITTFLLVMLFKFRLHFYIGFFT